MNKDRIIHAIEKGEPLSPFLFLSPNLEVLGEQTHQLALSLLSQYDIDKNSLFILPDTGESIKIEEMRNFLLQGDTKPRFQFQIFLIENISRMTTQSSNAALKFLEEPGVGNIILLTNASEAGVLETILSRVQTVRSQSVSGSEVRQEYYTMIENYYRSGDIDLVSYLYKTKLEKSDYQELLRALFMYITRSGTMTDILDDLERDIQGLEKNNLNGKYVVDKYLGAHAV